MKHADCSQFEGFPVCTVHTSTKADVKEHISVKCSGALFCVEMRVYLQKYRVKYYINIQRSKDGNRYER